MTDEQYRDACLHLGALRDTEMSKAFQLVIAETRNRMLEGMLHAEPQHLQGIRERVIQLDNVLKVLRGESSTMTI